MVLKPQLRHVCAARWARIGGGPEARARLAAGAQDSALQGGDTDVLVGADTEGVDDTVDMRIEDVDPARGSGAAGAVLDVCCFLSHP